MDSSSALSAHIARWSVTVSPFLMAQLPNGPHTTASRKKVLPSPITLALLRDDGAADGFVIMIFLATSICFGCLYLPSTNTPESVVPTPLSGSDLIFSRQTFQTMQLR